MKTTTSCIQYLLAFIVAALIAAACSNNDGTELTNGTEPTTLPSVVEETTTSDAPSTLFFYDAATADTTTTDAEHEHSDDTHTHDEPVATYPFVDPARVECPKALGHIHPELTDVHVGDEPADECHTHTCETPAHSTEITYVVSPYPCVETSATSTTVVQNVEPTTVTEPATTAAPPTTTTSVEIEVSQNVVCGEGLVKLDEFVTETDNGCRQAECTGGRNNQTGQCRSYYEWLDTLVRECPTVDTSDGLGAMGSVIRPGMPWPMFPQMVPGSSWLADIQLVDNDNWDWKQDGIAPTNGNRYFILSLVAPGYAPLVGEERDPNRPILGTDDPEGSWRVPFSIYENKPQDPVFQLGVSPTGAGCWAVRFTRTG